MSEQIVNISVETTVQAVTVEVVPSPVQEVNILVSTLSPEQLAGLGKGEGPKSSLTDPGSLFDMSITDDYIYYCVKSGTAGNAIWKKGVLFHT
jgi:hypothetical protein